MARPGGDESVLRKLKREKLKLKDEIAKLANDTRH
jgi:hypothetical protein